MKRAERKINFQEGHEIIKYAEREVSKFNHFHSSSKSICWNSTIAYSINQYYIISSTDNDMIRIPQKSCKIS